MPSFIIHARVPANLQWPTANAKCMNDLTCEISEMYPGQHATHGCACSETLNLGDPRRAQIVPRGEGAGALDETVQ